MERSAATLQERVEQMAAQPCIYADSGDYGECPECWPLMELAWCGPCFARALVPLIGADRG